LAGEREQCGFDAPFLCPSPLSSPQFPRNNTMSKEALTWFGIPIIMGIGFLLFRIAMDLPTEQSTNMLVGLMTLAVLVFGSIAGYKMLRAFWQDASTSRPTSVNPKPESQPPASKPAPVESQVSAIPTRADNPAITASDVHREVPASDTTTTPVGTQPQKTALFLGILLGLLLGVAIGLMSPFSLQFASRSDDAPDPANTPEKISQVPMRGPQPQAAQPQVAQPQVDRQEQPSEDEGARMTTPFMQAYQRELFSRSKEGQDEQERAKREASYLHYQANRPTSGPVYDLVQQQQRRRRQELAGVAQEVMSNKRGLGQITDDVVAPNERELFLQILSGEAMGGEKVQRGIGRQASEAVGFSLRRALGNITGPVIETVGSEDEVASQRFDREARNIHYGARAADVHEMPWMSSYFIRKATVGAAEMAPALAIGLLILIVIVAQRVRKKSCSSQMAARIPGGLELKTEH
jgi:hypothetical protein